MFDPNDVWRVLRFAADFITANPLWTVFIVGFALSILATLVASIWRARSGGD